MSEALTYDEIMALPNGAALWWPGAAEVLTLDIHDVRPAFNCVDASGRFTGHLYPYHVIEHCGEVFRISASTGGHLMTTDAERQANAVERIIARGERGEMSEDEKRLPAHITEADIRAICEIVVPDVMRPLLEQIKQVTAERDAALAVIADAEVIISNHNREVAGVEDVSYYWSEAFAALDKLGMTLDRPTS